MYKELLLDSSLSYNSSQPSWSLPSSPYMENFKVLSVSIPASFYGIGPHNNQVKFKLSGPTIYTAVIPSGQYNVANFPDALKTALNGANANGFNVTFDDIKKTISITGTSAFSILSLSSGSTAYRLIGSKKTDHLTLATTFSGNSVDLNGTNSVILTSNSLICRDSTYVNSQSSNVLALIPLTSPQNSINYWVNQGSYLHVGQEMPYINFFLLDAQTMQTLDLNGASFVVHLGYTDDPDDPVTIR